MCATPEGSIAVAEGAGGGGVSDYPIQSWVEDTLVTLVALLESLHNSPEVLQFAHSYLRNLVHNLFSFYLIEMDRKRKIRKPTFI